MAHVELRLRRGHGFMSKALFFPRPSKLTQLCIYGKHIVFKNEEQGKLLLQFWSCPQVM